MTRSGRVRSAMTGAALAFLAGGCSAFRGIPDHGGGKRFDEEQRAVAGAIRRAIAGMDLSELAKKRTHIVLSHIYTSGSGSSTPAGLKNVSLSASLSDSVNDMARAITNPAGTAFKDSSGSDSRNRSASLSYQPFGSYYAAGQCTEGDMGYFRAMLDMKVRHDGIPIVDQAPEVVLYVAVDVLGTNHSRRDFILYASERLKASCEITYYAQRVDNGELLFKSRQTGAAATYSEGFPLLLPCSAVARQVGYSKPVYFDSQSVRPANGGHLDVPERPDEVARACRQMTDDQKERTLEILCDRARAQIRGGDPEAAQQTIQSIRAIDPGYSGLRGLPAEPTAK